jgi:Fe-S-cluster-containing hydrogenase component 2
VTDIASPLCSLQEGRWFKLICGASFQHLPAIRTLALVYAIAGADCVDVAADPAIIATAREAFAIAQSLAPEARHRGYHPATPWLMVSLNDGEDPHFRKAEFDASTCPSTCPRPCEKVCPAQAIMFSDRQSGVIDDLCYGCGRCIPICPSDLINARSYVYTPEVISPLLLQSGIDAIEIHTQVGRFDDFARVWKSILPWIDQLKLLAISCPDDPHLIDYLQTLYELMSPLPCALIWQTDGRPMSGDIGDGATRACIKLGQKVLNAHLPGFVQLAGGTNRSTVAKLNSLNLLYNRYSTDESKISGIAYGSYARSLLLPILTQLEAMELSAVSKMDTALGTLSTNEIQTPIRIETRSELLWQAVDLAHQLVHQIKFSHHEEEPN